MRHMVGDASQRAVSEVPARTGIWKRGLKMSRNSDSDKPRIKQNNLLLISAIMIPVLCMVSSGPVFISRWAPAMITWFVAMILALVTIYAAIRSTMPRAPRS